MTKAIIIGAGIGGIATAIGLVRQGIGVVVYEAAESAGGKISERYFDGFRFDNGPSLLTLPGLAIELLDDDLKFPVKKLDTITKYFYPDGTKVNAFSDVQQLATEINEKLKVPKTKVTGYLEKAAKVYELTADLFIFGSFHRFKNLMNLKALKTILNVRKLQAFSSLHQFNERELGEKRLIQLFDRYATYNGSDPYQTPATLSVISHLEHNMGAFIPEDGMFEVIDSLMQQAIRLGTEFHFGQPVRKVEIANGKATGVWLDSGFVQAEIVVSDVDIHRFYSTLLPDSKRLAKLNKEERSSSALIFYWGMKGISAELDVHNIFFSDNYEEEFDCLFRKKEVFDDPTVYIYISSKYNKTDAPEACENWFVMINAPADVGQNWDEIIERSRTKIVEKLERMLDKKLQDKIVNEEILSPPDIYKQTGSVNGSLYGSSSNSRYASFNRPANFRKDIAGLYFVGGSVHPGGGIPLCLSSAKIVDRLVKEQMLKIKMDKMLSVRVAKILVVLWYVVGVSGFLIQPLRPLFQLLTPWGMLAAAILLMYFHEPKNLKGWIAFASIALIGFFAELIGVNKQVIFGNYIYGEVLGLKLWNTPLTIGINWLVLVYCISSLAKTVRDKWYFPLLGAAAMVAFDWLMEPVAIATGMWSWPEGSIPLKNYMDWFLISGFLFLMIRILKIETNNRIAGILLLMQVIFFMALNLLIRTPLWAF